MNCNNAECKCEKGKCKCCPSMYWHDGHNNLLQHWRKQASINLWLQIASNYYYLRINDWLSYPSILLSASLSIGVFGLDTGLKGQFVSAALAMLAGILVAINKHVGSPEKAQAHMLRAKDYYGFVRYLDCLLSTSFEERDPMSETMMRIKENFNRIVDMSLEPPLGVVRTYEDRFKPIEKMLFSPLTVPIPPPRNSVEEVLKSQGDIAQQTTSDQDIFVQEVLSPRRPRAPYYPFSTPEKARQTNTTEGLEENKSDLRARGASSSIASSSTKSAAVLKRISNREYLKFLFTPQQLTALAQSQISSPTIPHARRSVGGV